MTIEDRLGHVFQNKDLLVEALSHPSLSSERRPPPPDNQRLEFLGDAVLELAITDHLFHRFPHLKEGRLTKLRASLVSKPALSRVARSLKVGEVLKMSNGEEGSGGRDRPSNLADAMESLFGAVYLDAGLVKAAKVVLATLALELENLDPETALGNCKGELQEILQKISPQSPIYEVENEEGPPHCRIYCSSVTWKGLKLGTGSGPSKKDSEIAAASAALKEMAWTSSPKK